MEACQAATLRRLGLPHQLYKQAGAGSLSPARRAVRRTILAGLSGWVSVGRVRRETLLRDNGGDALDAVIAAVGAAQSWPRTHHRAVASQPRYVREWRHYA